MATIRASNAIKHKIYRIKKYDPKDNVIPNDVRIDILSPGTLIVCTDVIVKKRDGNITRFNILSDKKRTSNLPNNQSKEVTLLGTDQQFDLYRNTRLEQVIKPAQNIIRTLI